MEKLQDHINPCLVGEDLDVGWLEEIVNNIGNTYEFEDPYSDEGHYSVPNLEDKMSFLQMLQIVETSQPNFQFMQQEPNYFQLLLTLQHQDITMFENHQHHINNNNGIVVDLHSPVKSETFRGEEQPQILPFQQCNPDEPENGSEGRLKGSKLAKTPSPSKEKRKRKRATKVRKNKEEVETQRMTHIAVERNRRRQMNDHINALRSLMPPTYVQRGDQASIIGGAIDFVKEMEQLLESLQAEKRMRNHSEENTHISTATSTSTSSSNLITSMFMTSPTLPFQFRNFSLHEESNENSTDTNRNIIYNNNNNNNSNNNNSEEFSAENRSAVADIKVVVIQNHVNLKIQCQRRSGQLLKAIVAFEEVRLTILHLNITSLYSLVLYSFNLKIEEDCKLGTADEVLRAVHHIFSLINLS